ncbi:MFS transporter [Anaerolentibacter hominis]|uniref:MFS transporter n=1 Tax=Anaerolentibacter hominis TaxID=3079009 RepID=UPI0031B86687
MKKKTNFAIGAFYFFYFAAHVCAMSYMNVYLEKYLHFTGSQLGAFSGISVLSSVFLIPVWGVIGDKTKHYKTLLLSFLTGVLLVSFIFSRQTTYLGALVMGILLEASRCGILSMADTQTMNYCSETKGNYGRFRSMGSIGWVIGGMILGYLAAEIGLNVVLFPTYMLVIGLALLMATGFPKVKAGRRAAEDPAEKKKKGDIKVLFKNKDYLFILMITVMTGVMADGITSFMGNHLIFTLGGTEKLISLNTILCAVPEILYLGILSNKLLPKLGFRKVYLISGFALVIRFAIYSLASNPYIFLMGSVLHCFTVGCTTVVNLAYVRKKVPIEVYGTAVTVMYSANTLGRAMYGYIYGLLYEKLGSVTIFMFTFCVVSVAAVMMYRTKRFDVEYN